MNRKHFYPRSPCGERPYIIRHAVNLHPISIHALLAESDAVTTLEGGSDRDFYPRSPCGERRIRQSTTGRINVNFYPRSPCGERRWLRCWQLAARDISIHALLAESDCQWRRSVKLFRQFLSTLSLRRATLIQPTRKPESALFLSTLSLRRATPSKFKPPVKTHNFYPRSPCGERQFQKLHQARHMQFLSTLSLRRATL